MNFNSQTFIEDVAALKALPFTGNYTISSRSDHMFTFSELILDPWWNTSNTLTDMSHEGKTSWIKTNELNETAYSVNDIAQLGENQHTINELLRGAIYNAQYSFGMLNANFSVFENDIYPRLETLEDKAGSFDAVKYGGTLAKHTDIPSDPDNGTLYIMTSSGTIAKTSTTSGKAESYSAGDAVIVQKTKTTSDGGIETITLKYSVLQVNINDSAIVTSVTPWSIMSNYPGQSDTYYSTGVGMSWITSGTTTTQAVVVEKGLTLAQQTLAGQNALIIGVGEDDLADRIYGNIIENLVEIFNKTDKTTTETTIYNNFKSIVSQSTPEVDEVDTDLIDGYSITMGVAASVTTDTSTSIRTWTYSDSSTYTETSAGAGVNE